MLHCTILGPTADLAFKAISACLLPSKSLDIALILKGAWTLVDAEGTESTTELLGNVIQGAVGWDHSLAITEQGQIWVMGCNHVCQLGLGRDACSANGEFFHQFTQLLTEQKIIQVAAGEAHSLLLTNMGEVLAVGSNSEGQIDASDQTLKFETVKTVIGPSAIFKASIRQIACGARHSLAVCNKGHVYCWGWSLHGQCASRESTSTIAVVQPLIGLNVISIAGGLGHSLACTDAGDAFSWGWNGDGQLGLGDLSNRFSPEKVNYKNHIEDPSIRKVSAGARHSVLMTEDGEIYGSGCGKHGELGKEASLLESQISIFTAIDDHKQCSPQSKVSDVECGWWHTTILSQC